ncbi:uncharacterized protein FOMMEDRAFT_167937 [Fomitiporia mediterranea MF3/22]|uniref:uncharacterized protein n=1 Tax=Fomitiporia mediterranea (strain MF3/22) TaxID=694068 RepID=UPI0004408FDD|nr:uncharacterized protein FOMMEDRAFT_167937 [Fomitiporia mediterranea MF3/22]EJD02781.1 hypothetical protein FOMMEDRAFT_167937 [Fomitiporia mediterranea MF3/22]
MKASAFRYHSNTEANRFPSYTYQKPEIVNSEDPVFLKSLGNEITKACATYTPLNSDLPPNPRLLTHVQFNAFIRFAMLRAWNNFEFPRLILAFLPLFTLAATRLRFVSTDGDQITVTRHLSRLQSMLTFSEANRGSKPHILLSLLALFPVRIVHTQAVLVVASGTACAWEMGQSLIQESVDAYVLSLRVADLLQSIGMLIDVR